MNTGLEPIAAACDVIATTTKALQFKTARFVSTGRSFDASMLLDTMAAAWDHATVGSRRALRRRDAPGMNKLMARARILGARSAQPLEGSWQLASLAPAPTATPIDLDDLNPSWIDCDRPLPVASALRAAGRWDVDRSARLRR